MAQKLLVMADICTSAHGIDQQGSKPTAILFMANYMPYITVRDPGTLQSDHTARITADSQHCPKSSDIH